MRKPVIGITCYHDWEAARHRQNDTYLEAVKKASGLPVLLPCLTDIEGIKGHLDLIDGLLVSGGPDVDPLFFGEEPEVGLGNIHPLMDSYEIPLIREALRRSLPILGICRGVQMLNVAAGGTLIQHIPNSVVRPILHRQNAPRSYMSHSIALREGTLLARIMGATDGRVNSFHHQAVGKVAPGFIASAHAPDGVIEAIEGTSAAFALGVQWHPECMWNEERNYDDLFTAFVSAAASFGDNKRGGFGIG